MRCVLTTVCFVQKLKLLYLQIISTIHTTLHKYIQCIHIKKLYAIK